MDQDNTQPLIQMGHPEREEVDRPKLADGSPLYWALVPPDSLAIGFIKPSEAHAAKVQLEQCLDINENAVLNCKGKTADEARKILQGILAN